jgi:PAS domain S-box-containing protein
LDILISLINNTAILLALAIVYDTFLNLNRTESTYIHQLVTGLILGALGVAVMLNPLELLPGIVFDARSVLLSISGLFFGSIPTFTAVIITAAFRIFKGGTGALTGVSTIMAAGIIGLIWRSGLKNNIASISKINLYTLGIVVTLTDLMLMFTLPWPISLEVLSNVSLPVMLIYPVGTTLLGALMVKRIRIEIKSAALRESEKNFRALVEQSLTGIYCFEEEKFSYVNSRFCEIFGYSENEVLNNLLPNDVIVAETQPIASQNIESRKNGEIQSFHYTAPGIRKDGTRIWVEIHGSTIKKGNTTSVTGTVLEITEKMQNLASLKRLNERLTILRQIDRNILAARTSDVVANMVLINIQRLIPCSSAALNLLNKEPTEMTFSSYETDKGGQKLVGECFLKNPSSLHGRLASGQTFSVANLTKMESDLDVFGKEQIHKGMLSALFSPLMVKKKLAGKIILLDKKIDFFTPEHREIVGEISALLSIFLNQNYLDDQIRKHSMELETRVEKRTNELNAVNKELENFTYSVSHDLKAPLRGIDGYSRLIFEKYSDQLDEEGTFFLKNILQGTAQMSLLIEDLLSYSKLERRRVKLESIDIRNLIELLIKTYESDARKRNITITLNLPTTKVKADFEGLSIAVRNLLDNAFKFTINTPRPVIEIGGSQTVTSCIIWIKDNGLGFDMKFHDRIFKIFQHLNLSEEYPGTGIGLAMVKKSMERMNGRIWAESEPGKGAVFYMELPR